MGFASVFCLVSIRAICRAASRGIRNVMEEIYMIIIWIPYIIYILPVLSSVIYCVHCEREDMYGMDFIN